MARPETLVLGVHDTATGAEAAALCGRVRTLLERSGAAVLVCDVSRITRPDAGTLDTLARVQLVARRLGRELRLRRACCHLLGLLALSGLDQVLAVEATARAVRAARTAGRAAPCRGTRSSR